MASEKKRASSSNDGDSASARTSDEKEKSQAVKIDVVADKTGSDESEGLPPVPFFDMFRFSTRLEIFLDGRS